MLVETFDRLATAANGALSPDHVSVLRKRIEATVAQDTEGEVVSHIEQVVSMLAAAGKEAGELPWPASKKELHKGLKHSQRRLRKTWKAALDDPKIGPKMVQRIPLRRVGQPEEVGPLVAYLASDLAAYMTGSVVVFDGGQTAR